MYATMISLLFGATLLFASGAILAMLTRERHRIVAALIARPMPAVAAAPRHAAPHPRRATGQADRATPAARMRPVRRYAAA